MFLLFYFFVRILPTIFIWAFGLIILVSICLATFDACFKVGEKCHTREVVSIGGCDKKGSCGIRLNDGSFAVMAYPTVGSKYTECKPIYTWDK